MTRIPSPWKAARRSVTLVEHGRTDQDVQIDDIDGHVVPSSIGGTWFLGCIPDTAPRDLAGRWVLAINGIAGFEMVCRSPAGHLRFVAIREAF